jgi:biopolymer transport protein ExbD
MRTILLSVALATILLVPSNAAQPVGNEQPIVCSNENHWNNSPPAIVTLIVTADGKTMWNGNTVSPETFSEYLSQAAKNNPQPVMNIFPYPNATYATLAPILHKIQERGIRDIWFGKNGRWIQD